eukprot:gnl/TRDRNA2_/TRDRNA2_143641_c0_seq1.p1 gnl/TRDRNA2_/TRDRNA2_143641_c0~~gnl/TRDRNA2_/TRDRNA2_143641_c0_seq1.p1  ORF type:complete len:142 (+),score=14.69 gnl/TRDRNA2_/TRDRNA2_143641_c0_seq1:22-426(+)
MVVVDTPGFIKAINGNQDAKREMCNYAKRFVHGLNHSDQDKLSDLYQSALVEGLWFRLMQEFNVRSTSRAKSARHSASQAGTSMLTVLTLHYVTFTSWLGKTWLGRKMRRATHALGSSHRDSAMSIASDKRFSM